MYRDKLLYISLGFIIAVSIILLIWGVYKKKAVSKVDKKKSNTVVVTSKTLDRNITGLRVYKPEKCYHGYTLFMHNSGERGLENIFDPVYLIDMEGNIVYQWMIEDTTGTHVQLKPNGHLMYNTLRRSSKSGLRELDLQSNVLWFYPGIMEHDFQMIDDNTFIIDRYEIKEKPKYNDEPYICPRIEIIDCDKNVLWQWKGEEHVKEIRKLIEYRIIAKGDWAHNNTARMLGVSKLSEKDDRFRKENIIFSFPHQSLVGIIDYTSGKVVWVLNPGLLMGQHSPTMLPEGTILIFDNGGGRGWSRIIKVDPIEEEIVWEYHAEPKENFFSNIWSSATQLPNGNILVCEGTKNRIFEITPEGEIVWDYISTLYKESGSFGIYTAYRYSPEYVKPVLQAKEKMSKQLNI